MDLKTKKTIGIAGIIFILLLICAASVYAYLNPEETDLAEIASVLAMIIMPLFYLAKNKKEERQKHIGIQLLIMAIVPIICIIITTYRWYVGLPPVSSVTTPEAALIVVCGKALVWFIIGVMIVIGSYHTDEIVEKMTKR